MQFYVLLRTKLPGHAVLRLAEDDTVQIMQFSVLLRTILSRHAVLRLAEDECDRIMQFNVLLDVCPTMVLQP